MSNNEMWRNRLDLDGEPIPELDAEQESNLVAWSDQTNAAERIHRMTLDAHGVIRLITSELIDLNDCSAVYYLQIIRHWEMWSNPDDPTDGYLDWVGPHDSREIEWDSWGIHYGDAPTDERRDYLEDHPVPRDLGDYGIGGRRNPW